MSVEELGLALTNYMKDNGLSTDITNVNDVILYLQYMIMNIIKYRNAVRLELNNPIYKSKFTEIESKQMVQKLETLANDWTSFQFEWITRKEGINGVEAVIKKLYSTNFIPKIKELITKLRELETDQKLINFLDFYESSFIKEESALKVLYKETKKLDIELHNLIKEIGKKGRNIARSAISSERERAMKEYEAFMKRLQEEQNMRNAESENEGKSGPARRRIALKKSKEAEERAAVQRAAVNVSMNAAQANVNGLNLLESNNNSNVNSVFRGNNNVVAVNASTIPLTSAAANVSSAAAPASSSAVSAGPLAINTSNGRNSPQYGPTTPEFGPAFSAFSAVSGAPVPVPIPISLGNAQAELTDLTPEKAKEKAQEVYNENKDKISNDILVKTAYKNFLLLTPRSKAETIYKRSQQLIDAIENALIAAAEGENTSNYRNNVNTNSRSNKYEGGRRMKRKTRKQKYLHKRSKKTRGRK